MIKLKNLIGHIFTKKNIKIFLLLFIVVWFFVWTSFAQSSEAKDPTMVQKITQLIHIWISILSWVWVVLATLAWKLMTNDFVYWTFLNLDSSLRKLWNMMKNLANFTLWFVLVFSIVKNLFTVIKSDSDPLKNSLKVVWKVLIAWVLIQMSWFLFAALLDISTIGTAAVWALPSQFIASNSGFQWNMKNLVWKVQTKLVVDFSTTGDIVNSIKTWNINTEDDVAKLLDTIMPSSNSMVWPFIFIWASVFNLYDLTDTSKTMSWTDDLADLFLSLWINWFVLFAFSIMLAFIFIFNLFRVITLWIIIPLMPFVMLVAVFFEWKNDKITWFLGDVLNYKKIIKLVFKPVYMTLVLSIILIVMVLVRSLVKADNWNLDLTEHNNMTIESKKVWTGDTASYNSSLRVWNIVNINMKLKDSIVDLLVYILCLILLVMLMKSSVSGDITWIEFIDKNISWLSKSFWGEKPWELWWFLWSVWVVPIGNDKVWVNSMRKMRENVLNNQNDAWARAMWVDLKKQDDAIEALLWRSSFSVLSTSMSRDAWIKKAVQIGKSKNYSNAQYMYSNDSNFREKFDERYDAAEKDSTKWHISVKQIQDVWDWKKVEESTPEETPSESSEQWGDAS